jgi:hypothetical protein
MGWRMVGTCCATAPAGMGWGTGSVQSRLHSTPRRETRTPDCGRERPQREGLGDCGAPCSEFDGSAMGIM